MSTGFIASRTVSRGHTETSLKFLKRKTMVSQVPIGGESGGEGL
jgi:hypothetical protein